MKVRLFLIVAITILVTGSLLPQVSLGAKTKQDACREHITNELSTVCDTYRAHLFGSRRGPDGQIHVVSGGETDEVVAGIFETKGRLTSELVEPLVESYRVFRCRSVAVCNAMSESFQVQGGDAVIKNLGCTDITIQRYEQCYLGETDIESAAPPSDVTTLTQECLSLVEETLAFERSTLFLAVGYDSGYRSLLQFAGMMDWMLDGLDATAVRAISDMVSMLGKLHSIPCFIAQCDAPRTSSPL